MNISAKLVAVGGYLPKKIIYNKDFEGKLDTSDEWITERTGIRQRHIAADGEYTSDLALHALEEALGNAGLTPEDLDGIIVATTTPDLIFPSVSSLVHAKLKINKSLMAFDINAVCTGFVYALSVADSLIKTGNMKRIAVIGAETMSRILNWDDRGTAILFGDGAGAFILERTEGKNLGVRDFILTGDGSLCDILKVAGGPSTGNPTAKLEMNGREVFKVAVNKGFEATSAILERNALNADSLDGLVLHQANIRILQALSEKLGIDSAKVLTTVDRHANTSAASIPLAFWDCYGSTIPADCNFVLTAFGGGMTWGALYLRT